MPHRTSGQSDIAVNEIGSRKIVYQKLITILGEINVDIVLTDQEGHGKTLMV